MDHDLGSRGSQPELRPLSTRILSYLNEARDAFDDCGERPPFAPRGGRRATISPLAPRGHACACRIDGNIR
jgi:hypothetical protein